MIDRRTDPVEAHEIWQARLQQAVEAFMNDEFPMTEAVFKATLYQLGYRNQELDAEFSLHCRNKYEKNHRSQT